MALAYGTPMDDGTIYTGGPTTARASGSAAPNSAYAYQAPGSRYQTPGQRYSAGFSNAWDTGARAPHKGSEMLYDMSIADRNTQYSDKYGAMASPFQEMGNQNFQQQQQMLQMLLGAAQGSAPSQSQQLMQAGQDENMRNMVGLAGAQRGAGGVGLRTAMQVGQQGALQNQQQMGAMRAAEMAQARSVYGSALQNQQNQLQAITQYYLQLGLTMDEADRQARMRLAESQANVAGGNAASANASTSQAAGAGIQAGAELIPLAIEGIKYAATAASDERVKRKVKADAKEVRAMLAKLRSVAFEYKEPAHGAGRHVGVMAQDLEKSRAGKDMVTEIGGVKHVKIPQAALAALSAAADLHKRVSKLEAA